MTLGGSNTRGRSRYVTGTESLTPGSFRNADDPNELTGLHWFASVDEAHAFANDPDLKDAMASAGVIGPPRIEISTQV